MRKIVLLCVLSCVALLSCDDGAQGSKERFFDRPVVWIVVFAIQLIIQADEEGLEWQRLTWRKRLHFGFLLVGLGIAVWAQIARSRGSPGVLDTLRTVLPTDWREAPGSAQTSPSSIIFPILTVAIVIFTDSKWARYGIGLLLLAFAVLWAFSVANQRGSGVPQSASSSSSTVPEPSSSVLPDPSLAAEKALKDANRLAGGKWQEFDKRFTKTRPPTIGDVDKALHEIRQVGNTLSNTVRDSFLLATETSARIRYASALNGIARGDNGESLVFPWKRTDAKRCYEGVGETQFALKERGFLFVYCPAGDVIDPITKRTKKYDGGPIAL